MLRQLLEHDDVIKWKHLPRYWPFVRGIHRSPVNSSHKGQWRGALKFFFICARIIGWVNNREAGDLRRHQAHCDVIVMKAGIKPLIWAAWWRHDMETFSALMVLCEGNSLITGEFSSQRTVIIWVIIFFLWCKPGQTVDQSFWLPVISDAMTVMWRHYCDSKFHEHDFVVLCFVVIRSCNLCGSLSPRVTSLAPWQ